MAVSKYETKINLSSDDEDDQSLKNLLNKKNNLTYIQNNQYNFNKKGEITSSVAKCGLDLNSDQYDWIDSKLRSLIHRNILFQIEYSRIVEGKDSLKKDIGSMIILNVKVLGGYSLLKQKYFYVNYNYYNEKCFCKELIEKCNCEQQMKDVDIIEDYQVSDYIEIKDQISLIAPRKFRIRASDFNMYEGMFMWIPCTIFDREYLKNDVLPMHIANSLDLAREFRGNVKYSNIFEDYQKIANCRGIVMHKIRSIVNNSLYSIRSTWNSFIKNNYTIDFGKESGGKLKSFNECKYLQSWQFDQQLSKQPIISYNDKFYNIIEDEDVNSLICRLRKFITNKRKNIEDNENVSKKLKIDKNENESENNINSGN